MTLLEIYETPEVGMLAPFPREVFNMRYVTSIESFDPRKPRLNANESGFSVCMSDGKRHNYSIEHFVYKYKVIGKEDA